MYVCIYISHIYITYISIYKLYKSKIRHLLSGVIFRFLPNLRRLNKIMKSVRSTNLKTN